jgi:hypothetical protein
MEERRGWSICFAAMAVSFAKSSEFLISTFKEQ